MRRAEASTGFGRRSAIAIKLGRGYNVVQRLGKDSFPAVNISFLRATTSPACH
jgi:hypothetical protein